MDKGEEAAEEKKEWWGWEADSQEEVARGKPGLERGFRKKCGGQPTGRVAKVKVKGRVYLLLQLHHVGLFFHQLKKFL